MLIGLPSEDAIWDADLSMTNESADPDYAVENVQDNDPMNTARGTTTLSNIAATLAATITPEAAGVCNTNATDIGFTNGVGLNVDIEVPERTADGKQRNGWVDLRDLPNRTDDLFTFELFKTGAVVIEVGRLVIVETLYDIPVLWESAGDVEFGEERPGEYENVTRLGKTWRRVSPVAALRRMRGDVIDAEYFDVLRQLQAENRGLDRGFFFAPYADRNDWWFAQLVLEEHTWNPRSRAATRMTLHVKELSMGAPPDLD